MKQTKRTYLRMGGLILVLLLAMLAMLALVSVAGATGAAAPAQAPLYTPQAAITNPGNCTSGPNSLDCHLYAVTGTMTISGNIEVPIWGYSEVSTAGSAQLPGPTIVVTEGDSITITLHNELQGMDTALLFPGQEMIPDLDGALPGGTAEYNFTATNPGTYLYEAGLLPDAARQVAMGMFGALVVRPASGVNHAYDASSAFDVEALLVLSEVDVNLNADPANFDMRDFKPQYRLINGATYSGTENIVVAPNYQVLLRYINAGIQQHTMAVLGMDQKLIARDANLRPYPQMELAESIGPGRTADAIVRVPPNSGDDGETHFPIYDSSLLLNNNGASFGGMLTFLTIPDGFAPNTGPTTIAVDLNPNPTDESSDVTLSATIMASPTLIVDAAEYFVDAIGVNGAGCPMTIGAGAGTAVVDASAVIPTSGAIGNCIGFDLATLATGDHIVYVHGRDDATVPNWGPFNVAVLHLDKAGPVTSGLSLFPNPSAGDANIDISATGDDTTTGGSNIEAAEYFVDTSPAKTVRGTAMTVNVKEPIASLDATIDASSWIEGIYTINVRSQDIFTDTDDHWGDFASIELKVDKTGPTTSGVTVSPTVNNGSTPYNPSVFAIRVNATVEDLLPAGANSTIQWAEGYIIKQGALPPDRYSVDPGEGQGFPLSPRDGLYNETAEEVYAYIPMSTVMALGTGSHEIFIRGQDASGNWGIAVAVPLVISP